MKSKILVVEDDEQVRAILVRSLADERTEVITARDGAEALQTIDRNTPDLVLLDICMPRMNGYDVCKTLRENERTRNLPVIMVSSLAEIADRLHGLKCGADDYVTKPVDPAWLVSKIHNLLVSRKASYPIGVSK